MKTQIPAVNKVQVVLSKRYGELIVTLPSGRKYQHVTQLTKLDGREAVYMSHVNLVHRNFLRRLGAKIKMVFMQSELKGLTINDIEIVTSLPKEEVEKDADKLQSILNHLSVKQMTFRNKRYHEEALEDGQKIWKFMKENFMQDLQLLSN